MFKEPTIHGLCPQAERARKVFVEEKIKKVVKDVTDSVDDNDVSDADFAHKLHDLCVLNKARDSG